MPRAGTLKRIHQRLSTCDVKTLCVSVMPRVGSGFVTKVVVHTLRRWELDASELLRPNLLEPPSRPIDQCSVAQLQKHFVQLTDEP